MTTHPSLAPSHVGDPQSSFQAAAGVDVNRQMYLVLEALYNATRPLSNDDIYRHARRSVFYRGDTHHGLSTRRGKLEDMGYVQYVDQAGKSYTGRTCSRYAITPEGRAAYRDVCKANGHVA